MPGDPLTLVLLPPPMAAVPPGVRPYLWPDAWSQPAPVHLAAPAWPDGWGDLCEPGEPHILRGLD